jgi:hypothetical protein
MNKFLEGIGITVFFYVIVLMFAYFVDNRFIGGKIEVSSVFLGSLVMIIPYALLGLFLGEMLEGDSSIKNAFAIGIFVVIVERLSIYLIGFTYIGRGAGPYEPIWAIGVPYFTPSYIVFGGLISLTLCVSTTWIRIISIKREEIA